MKKLVLALFIVSILVGGFAFGAYTLGTHQSNPLGSDYEIINPPPA